MKTFSALLTGIAVAAAVAGANIPAFADDTIKIGDINSYSGLPSFTEPYRKGWQLALEEINAAGGVNGRQVEIISYDDHSSAAEAVRAFQRAATEDHVNAVIASYISEVVLALEP